MKEALIVTLYGNNNYGNKLQNYAVQQLLLKHNINCLTLKNNEDYNKRDKRLLRYFKAKLKRIIRIRTLNEEKYYNYINKNKERTQNFIEFDKKIHKTKRFFNFFSIRRYNKFDYYVVGSDQVWNPSFGLFDLGYLRFIKDDTKKIALSASFGVDNVSKEYEKTISDGIKKFKAISVRENSAKDIIEKTTNRTDAIVLLDPTMLVDIAEWNKIACKPRQFEKLCPKNEKYILNYFLGKLDAKKEEEIKRIAKENNCRIINILDKEDPFYSCGPSEFVWLEKNAFLICTDSFHSCVFAILYNVPFVVFNRDDGQKGKNSMNSRIETLLGKFELEDRYFKTRITNELLKADYIKKERILNTEREKAKEFIEKAFNVDE